MGEGSPSYGGNTRARFASTREVADVVNVDESAVRRWCEDELVLARTTPGGTWRIEVDAEGWPLEPEYEDEYEDEPEGET